MRSFVLVLALVCAAVAKPQFRPYNPINVNIPQTGLAPAAAPARAPAKVPAPAPIPTYDSVPTPAGDVSPYRNQPQTSPVRNTPTGPRDAERWVILKQSQDVQHDGNYEWSYETENGISAQESGVHKEQGMEVQGRYSYTSPDGIVYTVNYIADSEGFKPTGDHLAHLEPIHRALEYIRSHPPAPESARRS